MQIIYDGRKVQVWEFVFQGLNIGKWSTGKHCDGDADVKKKKRENRYVGHSMPSGSVKIGTPCDFVKTACTC